MPETQKIANENFLTYSKRLKDLHKLFRDNAGDSEEADAIRENMLDNWERMNLVEQDRARALSVDLKSLHRISKSAIAGNPEELEPLRQRFLSFRSARDWDGIINLFQTNDLQLPAEGVFFMRGRAWESLGDVDTAILFYEEALKISPNDKGINILHWDALVQAGRYEEAEQKSLAWLSAGRSASPLLSIMAAVSLFDIARRTTPGLAKENYTKLIRYLEAALDGIKRFIDDFNSPEKLLVVCAMVQLALAYEHINQHERAVQWANSSTTIRPDERFSLLVRGYIQYARDPDAAARDFEKVLKLRGELESWAHFYLGHYKLGRGEWKSSLFHARSALQLHPAESMRASLHEWIAISMSELEYDREEILAHFGIALKYEPDNVRIKANREFFKKAVHESTPDATSSEARTGPVYARWNRAELSSIDPMSFWGDSAILREVSEQVSAKTSEELVVSVS